MPLDKQIEILVKQLELANDLDKLVTIHCVYEWEKLNQTLENNKKSIPNLLNNKIILHSFQGSDKIAVKLQNFNVWYSLSPGCFNEKNYGMIKNLPLDKILLESDAPSMFNKEIYSNDAEYDFYFKEKDHGGNYKFKNHPMSILPLAKKISEIRKIEYSDFISTLSKNYKKLMNILI